MTAVGSVEDFTELGGELMILAVRISTADNESAAKLTERAVFCELRDRVFTERQLCTDHFNISKASSNVLGSFSRTGNTASESKAPVQKVSTAANSATSTLISPQAS